jgi:hypothetical protein
VANQSMVVQPVGSGVCEVPRATVADPVAFMLWAALTHTGLVPVAVILYQIVRCMFLAELRHTKRWTIAQ